MSSLISNRFSIAAVTDLLKLSDETDLDILNHSMEAMVDRFQNELLPRGFPAHRTPGECIVLYSLL
jgi:hypothetical protein